ncbi:hypothetical protein CEW87_20945 [Parazoarcus communis]|uniref:Glycosyl transferase family 1 n=1 Tax=Parazoarcus communis TaxID=41977 RepID=A0A2U8H901_9RHOO|nr:hypothetical protein [Parazoarcus communis]AWI81606.1 hypothetical protein CEW87_20945 [Parazoarcus communis]
MNQDLLSFIAAIEALFAKREADSALAAIRALVDTVTNDPATVGNVLSSPGLDELCQKLGAISLHYLESEKMRPPTADRQADVIILATELYGVGGHTRVIEDIIRAQPDKHHLILMTNFFSHDYQFDRERFTRLGVEVRTPESGDYVSRLVWTQRQLCSHPDAQVLVFNHHADVAAIAGIQPGLNREVVFCHHADHHLCLGAALDWVRHVDLYEDFCNTCRGAGIKAELWPLSVPDIGARPHDPASFRRTGSLLTACSGHDAKFMAPYPFHYWMVLPQVLRRSGGRHLHIGPLSGDVLNAIHAELAVQGVSADRFTHIPWVENLGATLKEQDVDLYIGSFPLGGGRAIIEAMAGGTPIVTHAHHMHPPLGSATLGPVGTWCWSTPDELLAIVDSASPEALASQSQRAREHYLQAHAPAGFEAAVRGAPTTVAAAPENIRKSPAVDPLAAYLLRAQVRNETFPIVFNLLAEAAQQ